MSPMKKPEYQKCLLQSTKNYCNTCYSCDIFKFSNSHDIYGQGLPGHDALFQG